MERRNFIKNSALAMALLSIYKTDVFAQKNLLSTYNFKPLRNGVGVFVEQGGTIGWLNSSNGFVVVDAQFPTTAPHVIAELKKLGDKPFKYLINTHHHGDHTAGNISFKGLTDTIIAHKNSLINQTNAAIKANNLDQQLLPNSTFGKSWNAKVGEEHIKGYYYGSGHTNGDAVYHFENANIVHVGDLVFNRRFPYIDRENGAHIGNWILVLDKIMSQFDKDTLFIWGHSLDPEKITGTKEDIRAFQNYLQSLLAFVGGEIKAGKTKAEILNATTIPNASEWQGEGIQRSLIAAYEELKGL
ncbi:MBL fold metallo-hydrolase [Pedobacter changchengzhani]|uniref:MBL fold metallo-hydrolase n=1 Tax=Pedobacter changchengzhani TaxID=2529274 RepID=A0A4R5MJX2_9SPHI|nr:MBL fold metallo-hydrolase [Pedobacter changchengzhani]TDG35911.1 MBL fold metallo-hydrolase [Pedobacter changchengzhani]